MIQTNKYVWVSENGNVRKFKPGKDNWVIQRMTPKGVDLRRCYWHSGKVDEDFYLDHPAPWAVWRQDNTCSDTCWLTEEEHQVKTNQKYASNITFLNQLLKGTYVGNKDDISDRLEEISFDYLFNGFQPQISEKQLDSLISKYRKK